MARTKTAIKSGNVVQIWKENRVFVLTWGPAGEDEHTKLYILNEHSLKWNLKHQLGLDKSAVQSVMSYLASEGTCEFNMENVG